MSEEQKPSAVMPEPPRMPSIIEAPPRTECSCAACVQCCKERPGPLAPGDLENIRAHQPHLTTAEFLAQFRSSEGALVQLRDDQGVVRQRRQRTIVPHYDRRRKRCVFLGDDDRCTIHAVKPAGCAIFDTHMNKGAADARSYWLLMQQSDAAYQEQRKQLKISDLKPVRL